MDAEYRLFYRSNDWLEMRAKVLKMFGRSCMKCGVRKNIHVDHIYPRSKFIHLQLDITNLQVLCKCCNEDKSNIDYTDYRSEDQKKMAKVSAGKFGVGTYIKKPKRKFGQKKPIENEVLRYKKFFTKTSETRYRAEGYFDVCIEAEKIIFHDGSKKSIKHIRNAIPYALKSVGLI